MMESCRRLAREISLVLILKGLLSCSKELRFILEVIKKSLYFWLNNSMTDFSSIDMVKALNGNKTGKTG